MEEITGVESEDNDKDKDLVYSDNDDNLSTVSEEHVRPSSIALPLGLESSSENLCGAAPKRARSICTANLKNTFRMAHAQF